MRLKFFFESVQNFLFDSKNSIKIDRKILIFKINAFELVAIKSPLLWREYLASAVNGLTTKSKISNVTKRDFFHLYLWENDEKVG